MPKTNGFPQVQHVRSKSLVQVSYRPQGRPLEAATYDVVPQAGISPPLNQEATAQITEQGNAGSETAVADPSRSLTTTTVADFKFPLCDAAIQKREDSEWELAYAILAECSEPGKNGVQNGSYEKMKAMRDEIAKNRGINLSLDWIRKLRTVASRFPPGSRLRGVSLEAHRKAGTPEVLDAFIKASPAGTRVTRKNIDLWKHPTAKAEQNTQKEERGHQIEDQHKALLGLCRGLERENDGLEREKEEREQRYVELCRSIGKEPEPFSPPMVQEDEPPRSVAVDLPQDVGRLLLSYGVDPATDILKQAITNLVKAAQAQTQ